MYKDIKHEEDIIDECTSHSILLNTYVQQSNKKRNKLVPFALIEKLKKFELKDPEIL